MKIHALLLASATFVLLLAGPALAQQPAPEMQRQDETPTLTNDDVPATPIEGQPAGAQTEPPAADDSALTPEERADAAASKKQGGAKNAGKATDKKKGPSAAELSWRSRYAQAQSAARAARTRAQEAELRVTELRNRLGSTGTVDERNAVAAEIEEQGNIVRQAQQEASDAEAAVKSVKAEGDAQGFKPDAGPAPTTKSGDPNPQYYTGRVAAAQADLDDAERRLKLYQDRVSDARGRILNNSGSGDNYAQMKIQEELDAALKELDKAQTDRDAAQQRLDAATQEAASAGVPLPQP